MDQLNYLSARRLISGFLPSRPRTVYDPNVKKLFWFLHSKVLNFRRWDVLTENVFFHAINIRDRLPQIDSEKQNLETFRLFTKSVTGTFFFSILHRPYSRTCG